MIPVSYLYLFSNYFRIIKSVFVNFIFLIEASLWYYMKLQVKRSIVGLNLRDFVKV